MFHHVVYLSLGSNLGHRLENLITALARIHALSEIQEMITSHIYCSTPVGFLSQNDFYNLIACITTTYPLRTLFEKLKLIENQLGKQKKLKNYPRVLDIDLISYDTLAYESDDLILPHPEWKKRAFVVYPLLELIDYLGKENLKELSLKIDPKQKISRLNFTPPFSRQRILE